jgi:Tol biopolymer transport system component
MKSIIYTSLLLLFFVVANAQTQVRKSAAYLGETPPGIVPVKFAPKVVSLENVSEFGSVFSKDGMEFFYGVDINRKAETRIIKRDGGEWSKSETLLFDDVFSYNDPCLSPDGNKLFFISDRPLKLPGEKKDYDIWYVERNGSKWSLPINAGDKINSDKNEYYISFSKNGTMYFASNRIISGQVNGGYNIYSSTIENGEFKQPVQLDDAINTQYYEADVFIAPDQSYLIFCGDRPDGNCKGDLYVSFKTTIGRWTNSKNMGKQINTSGHELCPAVTPDGKFFFYTSNQDIYWVDARIIDSLR